MNELLLVEADFFDFLLTKDHMFGWYKSKVACSYQSNSIRR